ncbi:MAG: translation initiation factor IF-2 [Drouetiella hepatica Uher 2000/2452]|uniref:Translation initiation factor IF-2 n=1 Tax=Drouetiella hepatica Uher 2000/2452 TaxID=904376 RepID=A0A951UQ97_9CYAN|nr:translation initiation factor IF-2 [Drouetiella hepatica Uher 2000/2452]
MNNGKVRIYELSKELNLDNRDLLAVCEQLNISVKSHSSTITESEAAKIRVAAEKYVHSPVASRPNPAPSSPAATAPRQPISPPPVKKQQILEIRRNRPLAEPPRRPDSESDESVVDTAPVSPRVTAKPSLPVRPVKANSSASPSVASVTTSSLAEPAQLDEVEQSEQLDPIAPTVQDQPALQQASPPRSVPSANSIAIKTVDPVELTPPPRPAARSDAPLPNLVSRPMLKRARVGASEGQGEEVREPIRSGVAAPIKDGPRRVDRTPGGETALRPKPAIELRLKPVRPAGGTEENGKTAVPGAAPTGVEGTDDLRRPTPPRPPKRNKSWEEEEEEAESAKAAAPKAKRSRTQVVEDDDEIDLDEPLLDDDDSYSDEPSPIQVSLSLARPPKPKGKPGQVSKPTAAAPQRNKRSTSGGESSSRGFRRDRRQEEVRQRPEHLVLTNSLSVHDLADLLVVPETELIKVLFIKGIAANINQILDIPTAAMVAKEFEIEVETGEAEAEAKKVTEMLDFADMDSLQRRPPVVTIMGHVDHGKTTLLDSIRKTKVAQGEAGGITQHIGAYHVDVEHDGKSQQVVFLDTPGHEAFTAMRARGARVTDIAILVVAADDGVRPQTIEAISHAKAAGVPLIVAINKIDKEGAQPERVKQELTEYGLVSEEWGGDTIMVPVSAINGENLDTLLEMILLVAEVEDLSANPDRSARGTVIEANLDKSRGPVATLIIQNGTLKVGNILVAGSVFGKVRAMVDDRGKRVTVASPSFAVEVLGLGDVPAAGDEFEVYADEKEARAVASSRMDQQRQSRLQQAMGSRRVSLNTISAQVQEGELKELNLILKADVQGSVEALLGALQQLPQKEVQVRVLLAAPGEITETDVDLAAASSAVIVGFNTTFASGARLAADTAGVDVRDYNIIYKLLEDIQAAMEGLLDPEMVEEPLGQIEVRAVFPVGRGAVAGCYVLSGKIVRNCRIRIMRNKAVVHEGNLDSLKRMKDDVKEVNSGYECGIGLDNFKDWAEGDIVDAFRLVSKRRTLTV